MQEIDPRRPHELACPKEEGDSSLPLPSNEEYSRKWPINVVIFLTNLSKLFTRPSKTCQIKNMIFLGIFIFQTTSKIDSLKGEGSNNNLKKNLQEKASKGLGLRTRTSYLPALRLHTSNKERKEATFVISLLDKLQREPKEKDRRYVKLQEHL